jgi:AcrR family transcriptional regulator
MPRTTGAKQRIEQAAVALFAARGVAAVSIGEIAAAAGVSQGALYRHYPSKEDLAWSLFSTAYLRSGAELDEIRLQDPDFAARIRGMVTHFCTLFDNDPALFRFMLIAQHGLLPRVQADQRTPVDAVVDTVADAVRSGEIAPLDPQAAAAVIFGIVLQTALFHIYGRLPGTLCDRAGGLAGAITAAVRALGRAGP